MRPTLLAALGLLVAGVLAAGALTVAFRDDGTSDPASADGPGPAAATPPAVGPGETGSPTERPASPTERPASPTEQPASPPSTPLELRPDLLDDAVSNAGTLYPQVEEVDRSLLEGLVLTACELVRRSEVDPAASDAGVVDAIVAAVPTDTGVGQFLPLALLVTGRYVDLGGCDTVASTDAVVSELQDRVGAHLTDP